MRVRLHFQVLLISYSLKVLIALNKMAPNINVNSSKNKVSLLSCDKQSGVKEHIATSESLEN